MSITKIVITGGPCAGKTTGMSWIQNALTERGYRVLFVPESATELITGGIAPATCGSNLDFQKCIMRLQIEKESVFEQAAKSMKDEKILIVCDRGTIDNRAYLSDEEYAELLRTIGSNNTDLRDRYDAVFHLVTAAKGAETFYTTENNKARRETAEEAGAVDDRLISAWTGHSHFRVIGNETGFEEKMKHLIREITSFLGEPDPHETERKYLIRMPDVKKLAGLSNCERVEIIQTYLQSDSGEEIRVRQRGSNGHYTYYETKKMTAPGAPSCQRIELEKRLTKDEYLERLMQADPKKRPIRKDRYCLMDGSQYFEIDVFPFWKDRAIMEIELTDPDEEIRFPKMIKVIREVTNDKNFRNANLAVPGKAERMIN